MNRRGVGFVLEAVGAILVVVALVGWLAGRSHATGNEAATVDGSTAATVDGSTAATVNDSTATTTTTLQPTTSAAPMVTVTLGPMATPSTGAPSAAATTTTATTVPAPDTVEGFVAAYRTALDSSDVDFLFGRLHPVVIDAWGADFCRAWIEREVVGLSDYTLVGSVEGPATRSFATPKGDVKVADAFHATVHFTYQGEDFQSGADFALVDGVMHWLGKCR